MGAASEETAGICLLVGLGNPGEEYAKTRHNIGFMVVNEVAEQLHIPLKRERRYRAKVGKGVVDGHEVHLLLPLTYMNLSGQAVRKYCSYLKISPSRVLVICDDVELPFMRLRLRPKGGSGGHKGLVSIQECLGTQEYPRLRVGIGRGQGELTNFVLGRFNKEEEQHVEELVDNGAQVAIRAVSTPLEEIMNLVNQP